MPATRRPAPPSRQMAAAIAGRVAERRRVLLRAGIARFLTLFLFALVAGIFWGTWLGLGRSISSFSPQSFLDISWIMIRNLGTPMAVLMPAALISGAVVLARTFRSDARASVAFTAIGLALNAAALLVTLAVNVPVGHEVRTWTISTLPENWRALRDRWEFYHGLRTLFSLGALAAVSFGVLVRRRGDDAAAAG